MLIEARSLGPEFSKQPAHFDGLDLHAELSVQPGVTAHELDVAWLVNEFQGVNHPAFFAWKVLRDPDYAQLYEDTGSSQALYSAGFFLDRMSVGDARSLEFNPADLTTPMHKINENLKNLEADQVPTILVTTGAFSPIHYGHLSMMETAKTALEERGHAVVGGYLSPSHDDYVGEKRNGDASLSDAHRIHLGHRAVDQSDWLMVDPWESQYAPTDVNFTEVIRHLRQYLSHNVDFQQPPKIVYVCGTDNAGFMDVLKYGDGGVCVSRSSQFNQVPEIFNRPDIAADPSLVFVSSDDPASEFSSSKVRQWKPLLMPPRASESFFTWQLHEMSEDGDISPPKKNYFIRDESEWAMQQFYAEDLPEKAKQALTIFRNSLADLVKISLEEVEMPDLPQAVDVHFLSLDEHRQLTTELEQSRPTLNLDACTNSGEFGINFSRLFEIADGQLRPTDLIARPGYGDVDRQIAAIPEGEYLFLDDDMATGATLNHLMGLLPERVKITAVQTLLNQSRRLHPELNQYDLLDIVDMRDFIIGSFAGGLVVPTPDSKIGRAPYMLPFVSPHSRAMIPLSNTKTFSEACWKLNAELFESLGDDIMLADTSEEFQNLMISAGFRPQTPLSHIARYYENFLAPIEDQ